jgi:oligopeptide transport system permease protein
MLKYTVKRLAQSLVTILLIATIVFLLMRCLPTDYYFTEEQLMKFTEEQKYAALEAAGLTDPIGTQLLNFYNDLLHLDFGTSRRIQNGASVVKVIGKKFGVSMRLGLISAGISLLVGIMLGILQTAFKDKVFDWIGTAYTVFVNAVPSLVSYSLVLVFGSKYLGFPTLYSTRNVGPSSVLPITCLSLAQLLYIISLSSMESRRRTSRSVSSSCVPQCFMLSPYFLWKMPRRMPRPMLQSLASCAR